LAGKQTYRSPRARYAGSGFVRPLTIPLRVWADIEGALRRRLTAAEREEIHSACRNHAQVLRIAHETRQDIKATLLGLSRLDTGAWEALQDASPGVAAEVDDQLRQAGVQYWTTFVEPTPQQLRTAFVSALNYLETTPDRGGKRHAAHPGLFAPVVLAMWNRMHRGASPAPDRFVAALFLAVGITVGRTGRVAAMQGAARLIGKPIRTRAANTRAVGDGDAGALLDRLWSTPRGK
jgi:hypothetical protein